MKVWSVAIVGRPNSGKSTLLNACIWESLAPVSKVPNTTRHALLGIFTDEERQILFLDSPGFQTKDDLMGKYLRKEMLTSLKKADVILRVRDVSRPAGDEDGRIDHLLSQLSVPIIEIYTKTDLRKTMDIPGGVLVTKKNEVPVGKIVSEIEKYLPEGVPLFDEDQYTDTPVYERIGEIIREQANLRLQDEIPHSLYVHVEDMEIGEDQIRILAYIVVEKESQKRIVIGKGGKMVGDIGTEARKRMIDIYERPVHLVLRVRVEPNWTKNPKIVQDIFGSHA